MKKLYKEAKRTKLLRVALSPAEAEVEDPSTKVSSFSKQTPTASSLAVVRILAILDGDSINGCLVYREKEANFRQKSNLELENFGKRRKGELTRAVAVDILRILL